LQLNIGRRYQRLQIVGAKLGIFADTANDFMPDFPRRQAQAAEKSCVCAKDLRVCGLLCNFAPLFDERDGRQ